MKALSATIFGLLVATFTLAAPAPPVFPEADRIRIAEAFRLADALCDRVWPGWNGKDGAPFAVLLVTPETEFLLRHPAPTPDFKPLGFDAVLHEKVWYRQRQLDPHFLATFPAVGTVSTIVIGQAENTEAKTSARWVITLLHEHFHQLQDSRPGYYDGVKALNLAHGDETGMWMLNYPFPYSALEIKSRFAALAALLGVVLEAPNDDNLLPRFGVYRIARAQFLETLGAEDARYFAFELWKEGIARYTEIRLAALAAAQDAASPAFRKLPDYQPYAEVEKALRGALAKELADERLDQAQRTVVYNFGAAEGLLLDLVRPGWRDRYLVDRFTLDPYFQRSPAMEKKTTMTEVGIDHLILAINGLDRGIELFSRTTGVKAERGGEHPGRGTANALVSLGGGRYLEILAPVTARPDPDFGDLAHLTELTPVSWAVHTNDLPALIARLRAAGFTVSDPQPGSRRKPDGGMLSWRTAAVSGPGLELAPFFIEWGEGTAHPSTTAPGGCQLKSVSLAAATPARLRELLKTLAVDVPVAAGPKGSMTLILRCGERDVTFPLPATAPVG